MEIVTSRQMRRIDSRAIEGRGIPGALLMESAGRGVAEALLDDRPDAAERGVLVLCGKGNNGGDGLVVARHLAQRGVCPRVVLLARAAELAGDPASMLAALRGCGVEVAEVPDESAWARERVWIGRDTIVVDAMLGTGIRGGARGLVATVIDDLERSGAWVVAVDVPSGLDGDSTRVDGPAVRAARTYTLCRPKLPLVLGPAADRAGAWRVVPIGIPDDVVAEERLDLEWFDAAAAAGAAARLAPRPADSHKGRYGHVLAVAGARGKAGAAILVGRGALRAGAGLVTVATPEAALDTVAGALAELMTAALPDDATGAIDAAAGAAALALAAERDALAIGPGLGTSSGSAEAVLALLARRDVPACLDADGLNVVAARGTLDGLGAERPPLVLTPHPGEAGRLLGRSAAEVQADRLGAARDIARRSGATVLLKGHRTIVADPGGAASVNASGNPGMATAGTGDVLTGVVAALLARGLAAGPAARLAAFLHGDAGDRAARDLGADGMIASDLADRLPAAFRALRRAAGDGGR